MAERLDAMTPRSYTDKNGEVKTAWTRIGSAFATKQGGWSIRLDALPIPQMGKDGLETTIVLMTPRADDKPAVSRPRASSNDDIPW